MSYEENRKILLEHKGKFVGKFIISIILNVLLLVIPIYYSKTIDSITIGNFKNAYIMITTFGILTILYRISEVINQKSFYKLSSSLYKSYMNKGLLKTFNNSLYSLSRFSLSEYSNIMSEDFELLSDHYSTLVIRIVEIFQFIYIIIYFFFINTSIGYITLFSSILVISILVYFNRFISNTNTERKNRNDKRISVFQEIFLSLKDIKGFNIFSIIKSNTNKNVEDYIKWNNKLNIDRYNLRQITLGIVDIFKIICLIVGIGLIFKGSMTLGTITLIYSYYAKLSELFTSIIVLSESTTNVKVAKKRIYKLFQYSVDHVIDGSDNNDIRGDIEFKNVLYGNKNKPILENVSFYISKNSLNILTGSVRSSEGVFDLLLRYNHEHSGVILIDNLNINEYSKQNISNIIGFVMEYPNFFNTSIRDNLLIFDSNFENIISVCKQLDIYDYIMGLPSGYETILVDNADNIDSDVKYLLALTRVFLKKSKVILLNNILDKLSQPVSKMIIDLIKKLKSEHTIILITRDIKVINKNYVDQVIFLAYGKVIGIGKHQEMLKDNDMYRKLLKKM